MAKQAYTHLEEFNEKKFMRYARKMQIELLVGPKQYLFDLQEYAKNPELPECIRLSVGSFESAIYCAEMGLVLEAQDNLRVSKSFNIDLPENELSNILEAAIYGGLRNFVKNLHKANF